MNCFKAKAEPAPSSGYNASEPVAFTSSGDPEKDKKIKNLRKVTYYFKTDDFTSYYHLTNWNFSGLKFCVFVPRKYNK